MYRKIFFTIVALASAYIVYGMVNYHFALKAVSDVPEKQVLGAENGNLTVVEFFDYRCRYCREIHPTISQAVKEDGAIRYIVRPIVFVDPLSVVASRAAYAAIKQNKFRAFHEKLIGGDSDPFQAPLEDLVKSIGADVEQFEADMASEEAESFIIENRRAFQKIGGKGTPTFIIGHKMEYIPEGRMPNVVDFKNMFQEARDLGLE